MAFMLVVAGCSKAPPPQSEDAAAAKPGEASRQLEQAAKGIEVVPKKAEQASAVPVPRVDPPSAPPMGAAASLAGLLVEPVEFHALKALLPDTIVALKLASAESGKEIRPRIIVSHALGRYQGDGRSLDLKITDPGTLSEFTATAGIWLNQDLDREVDNGYEKSGTVGGRRYHEVYDNGSRSAQYTVVVGNRFIVELGGNGIDMSTTKQALEQLDLARLESMKDTGVKR